MPMIPDESVGYCRGIICPVFKMSFGEEKDTIIFYIFASGTFADHERAGCAGIISGRLACDRRQFKEFSN